MAKVVVRANDLSFLSDGGAIQTVELENVSMRYDTVRADGKRSEFVYTGGFRINRDDPENFDKVRGNIDTIEVPPDHSNPSPEGPRRPGPA